MKPSEGVEVATFRKYVLFKSLSSFYPGFVRTGPTVDQHVFWMDKNLYPKF